MTDPANFWSFWLETETFLWPNPCHKIVYCVLTVMPLCTDSENNCIIAHVYLQYDTQDHTPTHTLFKKELAIFLIVGVAPSKESEITPAPTFIIASSMVLFKCCPPLYVSPPPMCPFSGNYLRRSPFSFVWRHYLHQPQFLSSPTLRNNLRWTLWPRLSERCSRHQICIRWIASLAKGGKRSVCGMKWP